MTIEYSQALDPHSWDTDMDTLKVGDPFTEAWIDRFRALMLAYNAQKSALLEAEQAVMRHDDERSQAAWRRICSVLYPQTSEVGENG